MRQLITFVGLIAFICLHAVAAPRFSNTTPLQATAYDIEGKALCETARETLAYLNKGVAYDSQVIHGGKVLPFELTRVKATLQFICQNQTKLRDPNFVKKHFDFIAWQPDIEQVKPLSKNKPLLKNLPDHSILMTKYYVHLANASLKKSTSTPYALYALPQDELFLTLAQANAKPNLIRFRYGKQAILAGALNALSVPQLAYVSRDDLESALMEGTLVADFGKSLGRKILNVHRNNNIAYDKVKTPYKQERYWYFKQVEGIKGYGKDADYKITVNPGVTFAADLEQFGLGKVLMVQYRDRSGALITRAGIFADTGGAFVNNLYQVDFLAGIYRGRDGYIKATRHLPDYVHAYFMILKKEYVKA